MSKKIKFNEEVRLLMKETSDILANAVKVTLGPKGRNVIISTEDGPHITKDGVSVARVINLEDPFKNLGAQLVKEVSAKTNELAGDGTTTATVLAQAMINEGLKNVTSGANPIDLKRGIDKAVSAVVDNLKSQSIAINNDYSKIEQVGTISANNDSFIGKLIADAMSKVGKDGIITVEESSSSETYVKVINGVKLDRGYYSPQFITDPARMEVVLENPYILITPDKITNIKELLPILEPIVSDNKSLLIIADEVEGDALSSLILNKLRTSLKVAVIKAPHFGEMRTTWLNDIAILTGGMVLSNQLGHSIIDSNIKMLGQAEKVIINKESTTILEGKGSRGHIECRLNELRSQIDVVTEDYEKKRLKEHLSRISGGAAVLYVGATTEVELKEKKDRIEDALCATKAATEEGIVPGGGVAYIKALSALKFKGSNQDETTGINIVYKSIQAPLKQIAENGGVGGDVIIYQVMNGLNNYGYNAKTGEFVNMLDAGIIDPTKVSRVALENAASVAGMFLTTDCGIVENES